MATVLFIGDPHFQINNIQEVEIFIEKITDLAREQQPDLICIGGDLLHTHERLHTIPLNKAYELVHKMREIAKTYVLVGNHDMINNRQYLTDSHWMNGMKDWNNTVIVDTVITETINDKMFVFVPYVAPGRFEEALETLEEDDWKMADCIFAHQEFFGCKMGAIVSVEGDKWPEKYPDVVSGHIHSNQTPQCNVYYPGSAMQHAFGESSKNIIPLLTFEDGEMDYELEEINLKLPRKKILYMDVDAVDDYDIPDTEDKIKITVSGVYDEFKAFKKTKKYKKLIASGVKVVFKAKKIETKKDDEVSESVSFTTILSDIVTGEQNSYLSETYELVVNNKQVKKNEIMFLE